MHVKKNLSLFLAIISIIVLPTAFAVISPLVSLPITGNVQGTTSTPSYWLGFSGYTSTASAQQGTIDTINNAGMTLYRMSFRPSWTNAPGTSHAYNTAYIDYVLAHSDFFVIIDGNHLYPPNQASADDAVAHWQQVHDRIFEILERYGNNPRVAVELINEYVGSDYNTRMQALITEILDDGYTNMIVVNKWNTGWHKFIDPLDNTYQGYHYYFNSWSVSGAESNMQQGLDLGIKMINTEMGADSNEATQFTTGTVSELSQFLTWSAQHEVSNCIWQNNDKSNWATYQSLGLSYPTPP